MLYQRPLFGRGNLRALCLSPGSLDKRRPRSWSPRLPPIAPWPCLFGRMEGSLQFIGKARGRGQRRMVRIEACKARRRHGRVRSKVQYNLWPVRVADGPKPSLGMQMEGGDIVAERRKAVVLEGATIHTPSASTSNIPFHLFQFAMNTDTSIQHPDLHARWRWPHLFRGLRHHLSSSSQLTTQSTVSRTIATSISLSRHDPLLSRA